MAQHDFVISNGSGKAVREDIDAALKALASNNSGTNEPNPTYAYQFWADTTTGLLKIRNGSNNAWITLRALDGALNIGAGTVSAPGLYFTGDANTGLYSPGADQFAITTNGVERVKWGTSEVVFNDGGVDYDFRVEGDTKSNLLLVDASADTVSVDGTAQLANRTPLRFGDSDNSHYVGLRAPSTVAANVTFDLPSADGTANQVLKTDGSGGLGWADQTTATYASTAEVGGTHTTGSVTSGSASLTVASASGIVAGMYIVGEGIAPGTTVSTIVGTTVTMSANAAATLSSDPVAFYIANKALSPGLVAGQLCRAWVNFNGTGTVAIRAGYNVSSITDHGTGDYTVNFTTAMVDASYSAQVFSGRPGGDSNSFNGENTPARTSSSFRFTTGRDQDSTVHDVDICSVAVFR